MNAPYGQAKQTPLVYYAFNLIFLEGTELRFRPLIKRRKRLATLLKKSSTHYPLPRSYTAIEKNFCR